MNANNVSIFKSYLLVTFLFVILLIICGYFKIGYLSDDYLNHYSANISSISEKFTSKVVYYNNLHFRPLWFLSFSFDMFIGKSFNFASDGFVISRIHNLLLYVFFAFFVSYNLYYRTQNHSFTILLYLIVLLFPNNLHSLLWITCRNDTQIGSLGFLSMILFFVYKRNGKPVYLILSTCAFGFALFFKETAIIFPFVIFIIFYYFYQEKTSVRLKDYIYHFSILLAYILYKLLYLNTSSNDILNYYKFSIFDRINVFSKAVISLLSSEDYLSLIYNYNHLSINLIPLFIPSILILIIIFFAYKEQPKKILYLFILFFFSIVPNIIAGYIRPQLVIVPFTILLLPIIFEITFLKKNKQLFVKYLFVFLLLIFAFESYNRLNEYKNSYNLLKNNIDLISFKSIASEKEPVFLFLPSRLKQTYILDYIQATYNFFKYKNFVINDSIYGFVNYAALDKESLNSEIIIDKINDSTITALCAGETQFFFNNDNNSVFDYENHYIKCEFQRDYMFLNKCKKVRLTLKDKFKYNYIALSYNKAINLNPN